MSPDSSPTSPWTFGENIRHVRQGAMMAQDELAGFIGVSPQEVCDIELGRRTPSDKVIDSIAKVLAFDRDLLYYLLGRIAPDLQGKRDVDQALARFRRDLSRDPI